MKLHREMVRKKDLIRSVKKVTIIRMIEKHSTAEMTPDRNEPVPQDTCTARQALSSGCAI